MVCLAPRAPRDSVRPPRLSDVGAWPLNVTVRRHVSFLLRFLRIELIAQLALILCALLFGLAFMLSAAAFGGSAPFKVQDLMAVPSLALMAYLYEVGPVAILFAPIYAILEARNRATVVTAALAGMAPGLAMLILSFTPAARMPIFTPLYSTLYMAVGLSVAAATHLFRTRGERSVGAA